jgi:predicted DNA-binding transcriptional regulator AlpA
MAPIQGVYVMATITRRLVTFKQLREYGIPYSRQHWDRLERAGEVPQRINLGKCRVVWELKQVEEWIDTRRKQPPKSD